jgi:hypothetical protein
MWAEMTQKPKSFEEVMLDVSNRWNLWETQKLWSTYMDQTTYFSIWALSVTVPGDTKNGAIKIMETWIGDLERYLALNPSNDRHQYEENHGNLLDALRAYAEQTRNEKDAGAVYDNREAKGGKTAKGDVKTITKGMSNMSMGTTVPAFAAETTSQSGGGSGTGGTKTGGEAPTELPAEFAYKGVTYYKLPDRTLYTSPKLKEYFNRPVKLSEKIITCYPAWKDKEPFPQHYVSSTEGDPEAPEGRGMHKCESCKMFQHPRKRCLQRKA